MYAGGNHLFMTTMVSLLECSGCHLKILKLKDVRLTLNFHILLQAIPSLEHLELYVWQDSNDHCIMDDILAQIFNSPAVTSTIPQEEPFMNCFSPAFRSWTV